MAEVNKLGIPENLLPWKDWVLYDARESLCPTPYNNGDEHVCVWPTNLKLQLDEKSGQFIQITMNYNEGWVPLPGDNKAWPEQVKINDKLMPVTAHQGYPAIYLPQGEYTIQGQFNWEKLPDYVQISPNTGTMTISLNGKPLTQPERSQDGKVWLRQKIEQNPEQKEDTFSIKVYRLIQDSIPQIDNTLLRLRVTGQLREISIGPVLQPDSAPLQISSELPTKLEENGMLRVQVKPGVWDIQIRSRFLSKHDTFTLQKHQAPWPANEIWAFEHYNDLRLVQVTGVPSIDPQQTDMPVQWKTQATYLMRHDSKLVLVEKSRGQEKHPSELTLQRQMWLDFSGKGYITQDSLSGTMQDGSRLKMQPPYVLSRATIDGQDKLITQLDPEDSPGVEIRQGTLNLIGVSRIIGRAFHLPCVGWDTDVKSLTTKLILPPGWMLLGAWGMDSVTNAWFQEWTLLDLFLVLIIASAVAKLLGMRWGLIALLTLTLIYRERGAPVYSWLNLIVAFALLKVFPQGKARTWILYYARFSVVVLIFIALPFMVKQIREAAYPQLTVPNHAFAAISPHPFAVQELTIPTTPRAVMGAAMAPIKAGGGAVKAMTKGNALEMNEQELPLKDYDPNAKIQTGPGIPMWSWDEFELNWNGPVLKDQQLTLWVLPSSVTSCFKILQVLLMIVLMYAFALFWRHQDNIVGKIKNSFPSSNTLTSVLLAVFFLTSTLMGILPNVAQADFPDHALLEDLKNRLLETPHCLPECADISRMQVQVEPEILTLKLTIHAATKAAIPLPSTLNKWMPQTVIVDGAAAKYLQLDDKQQLWIQLEQGVHEISLQGAIGKLDKFDVVIPLVPKIVLMTSAQGWTVDGIFRQQLKGNSLYFTRVKSAEEESSQQNNAFIPAQIPSFVVLTRTFKLGFEWEVHNTLRREAPLQGAISTVLPLMTGESVLSDNVEVKDNQVFVSLSENQHEITWKSKLKQSPKIELTAFAKNNVKEIWALEAISQWHCRFEGIPIIHQQKAGHWFPTWYPWPNETLTIYVTRPEAVPGETLTIENSRLIINPGKRATDNALSFLIRSSLGGTHTLKIPAETTLQDVQIDGLSQPLNVKEGEVTIPIRPGVQQIDVKWQLPHGIRHYYVTPSVNLNQKSSNTVIDLQLSKERWILGLGGPLLGPAILFWAIIFVLLFASVVLGKFTKTPLTIWQWFLLGLGVVVASPLTAFIVVIWFVAMRKREEITSQLKAFSFHAIQVGLIILTILFIVSLFTSISHGLLGTPQMQIGSPRTDLIQSVLTSPMSYQLQWYQDLSTDVLPHAWVFSLPLYVYRILMLLWALWLAFSLIQWLQWGWRCFSVGGLWHQQALTLGPSLEK